MNYGVQRHVILSDARVTLIKYIYYTVIVVPEIIIIIIVDIDTDHNYLNSKLIYNQQLLVCDLKKNKNQLQLGAYYCYCCCYLR